MSPQDKTSHGDAVERERVLPAIGVLTLLCGGLMVAAHAQSTPNDPGWSAAVENRLVEAGTNRVELVKALNEVSRARREGLVFLLENMPAADLKSLSAAFLLEHLNLAYEGWETSPWHAKVTNELFLNDVLPYACLSEAREPWRARLREVCAPIVAACGTPGEAAHLLNQKIFRLLNVRYNTSRRRPDQSPSETMKSGIATCTGLSILLVDACRSVGIPARVVGTPMWSNLRGNHTWVEVWDGGWHFAGAAEPDAAGLDRGWFAGSAAKAQRESRWHAIYATSFPRTGISFPLVWRPGDNSVSAVNVTDRYASKSPAIAEVAARVSVRVVEANGQRAVADIVVTDPGNPALVLKDKSRGETADLNDFAVFKLAAGRKYHVAAHQENRSAESDAAVKEAGDQLVTLTLGDKPPVASKTNPALPELIKPLPAKDVASLKGALAQYFAADAARQSNWTFSTQAEQLLQEHEAAVRLIAWEVYRRAPLHADLKADFDTNVVRFNQHVSPYTVKTVGTRPANGWALFIALHGGGGAPKQVNDSQWKHMQIYYKDHPEAGGYIYLALRAPNDTWNGFYDNYVYPLVDRLIRQFRLFGDIDPDKVFLLGYSHGGYGAYAIGPKMPDRFAAIHASAAAATDGETTGHTLRTTPFTAMVGERDTMYGRYSRNLKFKEQIEKLRGSRTDIYPVTVTIIPGNGHGGLPDRDKIADLYPAVRNPVPRELDWLMTDSVVQDFFWLRVPQPAKRQEILASCQNNRFVFTANEHVAGATVFMDTRLVDFRKPVAIEMNGSTTTHRFTPSLNTFCETLARRGDPRFAFSAACAVLKDAKSGRLELALPAP
jgi:transglutaminase-like putative cysteine protease/pimeloyl-ACP methyl ester carboxylesterase